MVIHFVCEGNNYRSRLSETYVNSLQIPNIRAISSGIIANQNGAGIISWYAQRIIQKNYLINFEKQNWTQASKNNLKKGDLTIFMTKPIYEFCVRNYGFSGKKFEIWNIEDVNVQMSEPEKIKVTEETYKEIKKNIDGVISKLK